VLQANAFGNPQQVIDFNSKIAIPKKYWVSVQTSAMAV
jgi:hypothetical protein